MPKLDIDSIPERRGSNYPPPFDRQVGTFARQRLGDAGGLTQFGVNRLQLPPGSWSGQRHWHSQDDEFVFVVSGELVLITDHGEQVMRAGDCAAFPANTANGHHLVNRGEAVAVCLEVGSRNAADFVVYPDIDLVFDPALDGYARKDGIPYPPK
ncbi:MAG: transcriptional regulator [Massilia sp.]|nr:transcriptional regulator [Massilia sp.]